MVDRRSFVHTALAAAGGLLIPARALWAQQLATGATAENQPAVSRSGKPILLSGLDLKELRASLQGKLLLPHDAGYDAARQYWDSAFDRHPGLIVLAAGCGGCHQGRPVRPFA